MGKRGYNGRLFKAASLAAGALVVALAAMGYLNPDLVLQTRQSVERLGAWGMLLYLVVQTLWVLSTVPSIPLFVLAGLVFGPWLGGLLALAGTTLGSLITFLIGRHALSRHVDRWRGQSAQFDRALRFAERHEVAALLIARTAPVFPLNLLNYALGALHLSLVKYAVISTLVSVPACAVYPALGEVLGAGALQVGPSPGWVWLLAVMIPGAVAALGLGWLARRRYADFATGRRRASAVPAGEPPVVVARSDSSPNRDVSRRAAGVLPRPSAPRSHGESLVPDADADPRRSLRPTSSRNRRSP